MKHSVSKSFVFLHCDGLWVRDVIADYESRLQVRGSLRSVERNTRSRRGTERPITVAFGIWCA